MEALTIDIRLAEPEDTVRLSQTHRASWQYAYNGLLPHKSLRDMLDRRDQKWWRKAITSSANIIVLDAGGVIAGYATFGMNRATDLKQEGEIYEIYLRPEFHGLGLGKQLFHETRRLLNSVDHRGCIAWCIADNDNAIAFYKNMGGIDIAQGFETFDGKRIKKIAFAWT